MVKSDHQDGHCYLTVEWPPFSHKLAVYAKTGQKIKKAAVLCFLLFCCCQLHAKFQKNCWSGF